jgi:hypothetical protein
MIAAASCSCFTKVFGVIDDNDDEEEIGVSNRDNRESRRAERAWSGEVE